MRLVIVGGAYSNQKLTYNSLSAKLTFDFTLFEVWYRKYCWLQGICTGSGQQITVSYLM